MAYIIIVNPKILEAAGIQFGPSMVVTAAGIEAGGIRSSLVVKLVSCL